MGGDRVMDRLPAQMLLGTLLGASGVIAQAAEPALTARWLASCDAAEQHEFFAIRVYADGSVRYLGGPEAKESGEQTAQIKPYEARYLITRGSDFIRAPAAGRRPKTASDTCMEFQVRVDGEMRVRRESIDTRASKVFANDLARKVPMLRWVCPAPVNSQQPQMSLAAFCRKWPDGVPLASGER
jgi:hypothetical protein